MGASTATVLAFPKQTTEDSRVMLPTLPSDTDLQVLFKTWQVLHDRPHIAPMLHQFLDDLSR